MKDALELAGTIRGLRPLYKWFGCAVQRSDGSHGVQVFENGPSQQEIKRVFNHAAHSGTDGMQCTERARPADTYFNQRTHGNCYPEIDPYTDPHAVAHRGPGRVWWSARHVCPADRE